MPTITPITSSFTTSHEDLASGFRLDMTDIERAALMEEIKLHDANRDFILNMNLNTIEQLSKIASKW